MYRLLVPLENEWVKGRRESEIVGRVKLLRFAIEGERELAGRPRRLRVLPARAWGER